MSPVKGIIPDFNGSQTAVFNQMFDKTYGFVYSHGVRQPGCGIALIKWIEANGYRIAGPSREVYVKYSRDDLAGNVTEIQFPVEKA